MDDYKFCKFCGNKIHKEAVFCPHCKKSLTPNYTVTIERAKQFYIGKSNFDLIVDGNNKYEIDNGETISIDLPMGKHKFYFSIPLRSKTIDIDLRSDIVLMLSWDRFTGGISVYEKQ